MSGPAAAPFLTESQQPLNPCCSGWAPSCWGSSLQRAGGLLPASPRPKPLLFLVHTDVSQCPLPFPGAAGLERAVGPACAPSDLQGGSRPLAPRGRPVTPPAPGPGTPAVLRCCSRRSHFGAARSPRDQGGRRLRRRLRGLGVSHNALFSAPQAQEAGPHHHRRRPLRPSGRPRLAGNCRAPTPRLPFASQGRLAVREERGLPFPPLRPSQCGSVQAPSPGPTPGPRGGPREGGRRSVCGDRGAGSEKRLPSPSAPPPTDSRDALST